MWRSACLNVYARTDLYEVTDSSLDDIRAALSPKYTEEDILALDKKSTLATDVMGVQYLPGDLACVHACPPHCSRPSASSGYVGMNNLKSTDYVNVVIQALCRVRAPSIACDVCFDPVCVHNVSGVPAAGLPVPLLCLRDVHVTVTTQIR